MGSSISSTCEARKAPAISGLPSVNSPEIYSAVAVYAAGSDWQTIDTPYLAATLGGTSCMALAIVAVVPGGVMRPIEWT